MNVLGLCGTPRKGGNSEILLDYALKPFRGGGWGVRRLLLSEMDIKGCTGCETCFKGADCPIEDDMGKIYDALEWCDAMILSTPVYTRNVTSQLMAVFDRTPASRWQLALHGKVGGAIAVGRGRGQAISILTIYNWMLSDGIICVPGELNGVTATASDPGDILKDAKKLAQAEILGKNILEVAEKLRK